MTNPTRTTLLIVESLLDGGPTSAKSLQRFHKLSPATLKRHVAAARELGAEIVSARLEDGWVYGLRNAHEVEKKLRAWVSLERAGTLL